MFPLTKTNSSNRCASDREDCVTYGFNVICYILKKFYQEKKEDMVSLSRIDKILNKVAINLRNWTPANLSVKRVSDLV